jgi:hypothetical protein
MSRFIAPRNLRRQCVFVFPRCDRGFHCTNRVAVTERTTHMKRMIAGVLLLIGMGAGTMFAEDGWRDRRDIRRDEAKIAQDRWELRRDLYYGNYRAARHERRELQREYRDVNRDRRDLYWDRR